MSQLFTARAAVLSAAAFALIACGGGGGDGDNFDGGLGDGGTNINRVSGNFSLTSVAESSVRKLPIDLTDVTIEAIMPNGERVEGAGETNGTFEILEVPKGPYTLRIGDRYFVTEVRRFDLSINVLGREDIQRVSVHTPISLSLAELSPWQAGDTVELFSASGGFAYVDAFGPLSGQPDPGSTNFTGLIDALLAQSSGEVSSAKGDVLHVSQVRERTVDDAVIREAVTGTTITEGIDIESGESSSIAGTLAPVVTSRQLPISLDAPAYTAAMSAVGPTTPTEITTRVRVVATPTDIKYGIVTAFPTLVSATISSDAVVEVVANVGSPFPTHWEELEVDELSAMVEIDPEAGSVLVHAGAVSLPGRLTNGANPLLGPASQVQIAGKNAAEPIENSGASPMITWVAPTVGGADGYEVDLIQIAPTVALKASLYTTDTSLAIPAEILETGSSYYLVVRSRSTPTIDLALEPLAAGVPSAFAEYATAPFTP